MHTRLWLKRNAVTRPRHAYKVFKSLALPLQLVIVIASLALVVGGTVGYRAFVKSPPAQPVASPTIQSSTKKVAPEETPVAATPEKPTEPKPATVTPNTTPAKPATTPSASAVLDFILSPNPLTLSLFKTGTTINAQAVGTPLNYYGGMSGPVTVTQNSLLAYTTNSIGLMVGVSSSANPGTYVVPVKAEDKTGKSVSKNLTVILTPDFTVTTDNTNIIYSDYVSDATVGLDFTVTNGQSTDFTYNVTQLSGPSNSCRFTTHKSDYYSYGVIAGKPTKAGYADVTISDDGSCDLGNYTLRLDVSAGGKTIPIQLNLSVNS